MALHTATDVFAHNTYRLDGSMIDHTKNKNGLHDADDISTVGNRYVCAKKMAQMVVTHIKSFTVGSLEDFYTVATKTVYDHSFVIPQYNGKANLVDSNYYNNINYKATFDRISTY